MSALEFHNQYEGLSGILNAFAYNLTKHHEDARDLYQETCYRALVHRDKFKEGTNFKAWVFTIMKNIFINNYRKKVKANTITDSTDNQFLLNSATNSVGNSAETSMLVKELQVMIDALDESIQVPFVMHYYGYKYQEIAEHLQLPLGTVKSRIFFARKELKGKIEQSYDTSRLYV